MKQSRLDYFIKHVRGIHIWAVYKDSQTLCAESRSLKIGKIILNSSVFSINLSFDCVFEHCLLPGITTRYTQYGHRQ